MTVNVYGGLLRHSGYQRQCNSSYCTRARQVARVGLVDISAINLLNNDFIKFDIWLIQDKYIGISLKQTDNWRPIFILENGVTKHTL